MLLALESDVALVSGSCEPKVRNRLLLKTLGSISLGDRYVGTVRYADGILYIQADQSVMAHGGRDYPEELHIA
jgi:hypothetical protein